MTALGLRLEDPSDCGEVQVWRADLRRIDMNKAPGLLSGEESKRARRFLLEVHRQRYIAARSWLRLVLGRVMGTAPESLEFGYGNLGKPRLAWAPIPSFNLSHSGHEAALAISWSREVGIDIEIVRPDPLDLPSAAMVLSPPEMAMVAKSSDRDRALLRCWVRKEAYAKALGGGLDRQLSSLTLTSAAGEVIQPPNFEVVDVEDHSGVVLAVALAEASAPNPPFPSPVTSTRPDHKSETITTPGEGK
jgi:4'-phosphopantetheinyl transferase